MSNAPIAGPRRARPAPPAPEPSIVVPTEVQSAPATPYVRQSEIPTVRPPPPPGAAARALPPLDYDEKTRPPQARAADGASAGKRPRARRVQWFVLGIAVGAVVAVFARGDAPGTWRAARTWCAGALRSLEHHPPAASKPYSMATASAPAKAVAARTAPCPVNPGPDDPCAELLAPFALQVPTVSVEDLPRVRPAPPPVAHKPKAAAPTAPSESAEAQEDGPASGDDGKSAPAETEPPASPSKPPPIFDNEQTSARNDVLTP